MPERGNPNPKRENYSLLLEHASQHQQEADFKQGLINSHNIVINNLNKELQSLDPQAKNYEKQKQLLEDNIAQAKANIEVYKTEIAQHKKAAFDLEAEDLALQKFMLDDENGREV